MRKYKHYFFHTDILTDNGTLIAPELARAVKELSRKHDVIILSNEKYDRVKKQLGFLPKMNIYVLAQGGNYAIRFLRKLWDKKLNSAHRSIISEHIRILKSISAFVPEQEKDLVQDRDGLVSYSLTGHHSPKRTDYDPDGSRREALLRIYPLISSAVQVRLRGNDALEYTAPGRDLRSNVAALISLNKWKPADCFYIGAFDEDLCAVIPNCVQAISSADAHAIIKKIPL